MTTEYLIRKFCAELETAIRADVEAKIIAALGHMATAKPARKSTESTAKRTKKRARNLKRRDLVHMICGHLGDLRGEPTTRKTAMEALGLTAMQFRYGMLEARRRGLVVKRGDRKETTYHLVNPNVVDA